MTINHDMNHDIDIVVKSLNQRILPPSTCILVRERRFPHLFRSRQPGKFLSPGVISPRTAIFGSSSKPITRQISKTAHYYPRRKTRFHRGSSWFVVVLSWFVVVHRGSNVMVVSWFVVVRYGL